MKIYVWDNENDDFNTYDLFRTWGGYVSGAHSGGLVIVAESKEKAVEIFMNKEKHTSNETRKYLMKTGQEYELKEGIYYFGDGDC